MLEIKGKVNTALCYAKVIEEGAIEQIGRMCDYELLSKKINGNKPISNRIYSLRIHKYNYSGRLIILV